MMVSSMSIVLSPAQLRRGEEVARERARWTGRRTDIAAPPTDDEVTREVLRLGFSVPVAQRVSAELRRIGGEPAKAIASGWCRHAAVLVQREMRKAGGLP